MIEFQKCMHCEDSAIATIGKENIPLCVFHYEIVSTSVTKLANKFGDNMKEILEGLKSMEPKEKLQTHSGGK